MKQVMLVIGQEELEKLLEDKIAQAIRLAMQTMPELYSAKQVCDALNITPMTLYNWEKQGKISATARHGRKRMYSKEDILKYGGKIE